MKDNIKDTNWSVADDSILNRQEKEFLENITRPFTKKYSKILVAKNQAENSYYLVIEFYASKNDEHYIQSINFQIFSKDKHLYEGMEPFKFYTLDELGLFKEYRRSVMNIAEALKSLLEGRKVRNKEWVEGQYIQLDKNGVIRDSQGFETNFIVRSETLAIKDWEVIGRPILTESEKEYIKSFIKPFVEKGYGVTITKELDKDNTIYLLFVFHEFDGTCVTKLPHFSKNDHMYEEMKFDTVYTAGELGLLEK